ncbi:hypothetical protein [Streptomyces sp. NPDC014894]|uniref:hypothetical protein n=1 Tax=unclassified Streptomyces TaxID=2593676 RepID=UPI0036FC177D
MNDTEHKNDDFIAQDSHATGGPAAGLLADGPVVTQDNHAPAPPRFISEAAAKPQDNHAPPPPAAGLLADGPVVTLDNHAPAPPRIIKEGAAKPLDNHAPAPPRP